MRVEITHSPIGMAEDIRSVQIQKLTPEITRVIIGTTNRYPYYTHTLDTASRGIVIYPGHEMEEGFPVEKITGKATYVTLHAETVEEYETFRGMFFDASEKDTIDILYVSSRALMEQNVIPLYLKVDKQKD